MDNISDDFKIESADRLAGLNIVLKYPELIETVPIWGLENLIKIGLEFEEYEKCAIIKKEIDRRK